MFKMPGQKQKADTLSYKAPFQNLVTKKEIDELHLQLTQAENPTREQKESLLEKHLEEYSGIRENRYIDPRDDARAKLEKENLEKREIQEKEKKFEESAENFEVKLNTGSKTKPTDNELLETLLSDDPQVTVNDPIGRPIQKSSLYQIPTTNKKDKYALAITSVAIQQIPDDNTQWQEQLDYFLQQTKDERKKEIFDRYLDLLIQKNRSSQYDTEGKLLGTLNKYQEWDMILENANGRKMYSYLYGTLLVILSLVVTAITIALVVIFPPIGAPLLAALTGIATAATTAIWNYFKGFEVNGAVKAIINGTTLGSGGILEWLFGYKRRSTATELLNKYKTEIIPELKTQAKGEEKKVKAAENGKKILAAIENSEKEITCESSQLTIAIALKHPKARFQTIELTGVTSDTDLKFLRQALSSNFTVTDLKFKIDETQKTISETSLQLQKEIERERLINCYLHGVKADEKLYNPTLIEKVFPKGIEELQVAAIAKLKRGLESPELSEQIKELFKNSPERNIKEVIEREQSFTRVCTRLAKYHTTAMCITAFELGKEYQPNRLSSFISMTGKLTSEKKEQIKKIQENVIKHVTLLQIRLKKPEQRQEFLTAVFSLASPKNIALYNTLLEQLKFKNGEKPDEKTVAVLQEIGRKLFETPETFKQYFISRMQQLSTELKSQSAKEAERIEKAFSETLAVELKNEFPKLFNKPSGQAKPDQKILAELERKLKDNDSLLSFEFDTNTYPEVQDLVRKTCEQNRLNRHLKNSSWKDFIATYSDTKMSAEKLQDIISDLDTTKILQLLTKSLGNETQPNLEELHKLDPEKQRILLEHCFRFENLDEIKIKAELVSTLLGTAELFEEPKDDEVKNAIKKEIYLAIAADTENPDAPQHSLEELTTGLTKVMSEQRPDSSLTDKISDILATFKAQYNELLRLEN